MQLQEKQLYGQIRSNLRVMYSFEIHIIRWHNFLYNYQHLHTLLVFILSPPGGLYSYENFHTGQSVWAFTVTALSTVTPSN